MEEQQDVKKLFKRMQDDLDFQDIKDAYERKRESERDKLINHLKQHPALSKAELDVTGLRGGKGRKNYTSHGQISPFDLRNWKWVEITNQDESFSAIISLNMPDTDPKSGNFHALYDRVGLIIDGHGSGGSFVHTVVHTDIDLPFDEAAMEKIAQIVIERFNIFIKNNEAPEGSAS